MIQNQTPNYNNKYKKQNGKKLNNKLLKLLKKENKLSKISNDHKTNPYIIKNTNQLLNEIKIKNKNKKNNNKHFNYNHQSIRQQSVNKTNKQALQAAIKLSKIEFAKEQKQSKANIIKEEQKQSEPITKHTNLSEKDFKHFKSLLKQIKYTNKEEQNDRIVQILENINQTHALSNSQYHELTNLLSNINNPNQPTTMNNIEILQDGRYTITQIEDKKEIIHNENNEQICEIEKLENGKYLLTHKNGTQCELFENILTNPIEQIKKITEDLQIWDEQLLIKAFVDPGASITICGKLILDKFMKYLDNNVKSSITAGGFDSDKTQQFYKTSTKLKLPIERKYFNGKTGEKYKYKEFMRVWYLPCVPDDYLILGRDNMSKCNIGLYNIMDLKELFFRHYRSQLFNIYPEDEDINDLFQATQYRNKGDPGIYIITNNNEVIKMDCTFARKSDLNRIIKLKKENKNINYINAINLFEYKQNNFTLNLNRTCNFNDIKQLPNGDFINLNAKTPSIIYTIEDEHTKQPSISQYHQTKLELTTDINNAVFKYVTHKLSNGTSVSYPEILDSIPFDLNVFTKDEVLQYLYNVKDYAYLFANSKFDTGSLNKIRPFEILIKDESKCRIFPKYKQNQVDHKITETELNTLINIRKCHYQQQHDPNDIVVHASPIQVAHRKLATLSGGNIVVDSRIVSNYSAANDNTYDYIYENLTIDELHDKCAGAMLTNQYDLKKWFYHFILGQNSRRYGALIWDRAIICDYVFHGLKNAPIFCHQIASEIFKDIAFAIQDDLYQPIFATSIEISKQLALTNFTAILNQAKNHDIRINAKKLLIGAVQYKRINKYISDNGIRLLAKHTTAALAMKWAKLTSKTDLEVFVGMVQYIKGQLDPQVTDLIIQLKLEMLSAAELPKITTRNGKPIKLKTQNKHTILIKSEQARKIFEIIQDKIRNSLLLHDPNLKISCPHSFAIIVDTSLTQTGALILQQKLSLKPFKLSLDAKIREQQLLDKYNLIALYSKKLHDTQQRYSATERELLGIKEALKKFRKYAQIKTFDLLCDCEPLIKLFKHSNESGNQKILRWRNDLGVYSFRGHHRKGKLMHLTDYMSRLSIPTDQPIESKPENFALNEIKLLLTTNYMSNYATPTDKPETTQFELAEIKLLNMSLKNPTETNSIYGIYTIRPTPSIQKSSQVMNTIISPTKQSKTQSKINSFLLAQDLYSNKQFNHYQELYELNLIHENLLNNIKQYNTPNDTSNHLITPPIHTIALALTRSQRKLQEQLQNDIQQQNQRTQKHLQNITKSQNKSNSNIPLLTNYSKDELIHKFDKIMDYSKGKSYLIRTLENNILYTTHLSPLDLFKQEQNKYFVHIINKIKDPNYVLPRSTVIFEHFKNIFDKLSINENELLVYNQSRIILTPSLSTPVIQYCHVEALHHKGIQATFNYMKERYYQPNMFDFITIYCHQCICKAIDGAHKNKYYKDKGPLNPYHSTAPNEKVFIDLFGPMHDGSFIIVMYDMFDGYLVLGRVYPTALNIIKFILHHWCYKLGFIKQLTGDNAAYFKSNLNKVYAIITNLHLGTILVYSPWTNLAETQMRSVRKGIHINKWSHDHTGLGLVYDKLKLISNKAKYSKYKDCLPIIMFAHNNDKHHDNFTPNESRHPTGIFCTPLELNLRLAHASRIKPTQYIQNKIIDYKKFIKLIKMESKWLIKQSRQFRNEWERKTKLKYNEQKNLPFIIGDYVLWKPLNTSINKLISNELYGWYIHSIEHPGKLYTIKNIFSKEIKSKISHGHLKHFYSPLWKDPLKMLESSLLNMQQYEKQNKKREKENKL